MSKRLDASRRFKTAPRVGMKGRDAVRDCRVTRNCRKFFAGWIAAVSLAIPGCSSGGLSADVHQGFATPPPQNDPGAREGRSSGPPYELLSVSAIVARPPGQPPIRVRMEVPAGWKLRKVRAKDADAYEWRDPQAPFDRIVLISDGRSLRMKGVRGKWDVQRALASRGVHWTAVSPDGLSGRFVDRSPQYPAVPEFSTGLPASPTVSPPPESREGEGAAVILLGRTPLLVFVEVFAPPGIAHRVLAGIRFPAVERPSGKG